jgi:Na+/proline symporter
VSVNFIFLIVGLLVSSAVPALVFLLTWSRVPKGAVIASTLGGQAAAIIAWLVHTQIVYSSVNINTSQAWPSALPPPQSARPA